MPALSEGRIASEFFLVSICMFTLPFGAFFGTKHLVQTQYPPVTDWDNLFAIYASVAASVLTVWIIIMLYAFRAFNDESNYTSDDVVQDSQDDKKED